jgi:DMSO/TMAO reductase YedYZ molybdopterin-dependent catalytic subunit
MVRPAAASGSPGPLGGQPGGPVGQPTPSPHPKAAMSDRLDVRDPGERRLPPGQIVTRKWPVLHYGTVPSVDLQTWRFTVNGTVASPLSLAWEELMALPRRETVCDIHCVTRWSRYDNVFEGVPVQAVLERAKVSPTARYALVHAAQEYTTNLPLSDLDRPANLLALTHNGEPLVPEHGGPVRLLVPHLYFWKSAKWVTGFQLLEEDYPGFWEQNGYHMRGDPWREERYGRPDPVRMRRGPH